MNPVTSRSPGFRRNQGLESLLLELESIVGPAEASYAHLPDEPAQPVLLVVGAPRSGTTLSMQLLAGSGQYAYPSNLLSRFYASPYVGCLVQKLLTDPHYDFRGEMAGIAANAEDYASTIGKTRGPLQPSEFWYFWRRFIPNQQPRVLTPEEEALVDVAGFRRGVASIEAGQGHPFATKGMILQYNPSLLHRIFPKALFLFVSRDPTSNVRSLLHAREQHAGNRETWFSVEPPGWRDLLELTPEEQVAGQIGLTNRALTAALSAIPACNQLSYTYEELCAAPTAWLDAVEEKVKSLGGTSGPRAGTPPSFSPRNDLGSPDPSIERAVARFFP